MRFGGHETFAIREGWLHKGLKLLVEDSEKLIDEYAADWLGVGRNMAKSIRHWLVATGLAEGRLVRKGQQTTGMVPTKLGKLIYKKDPYFLESGTWWLLHLNLVRSKENAATWAWFFSHYNIPRFEKPVCLQSLRRYLEHTQSRLPSGKTLERDLGCLLATYSRRIPQEHIDPEEARDCPFIELDLMTYFKDTGSYQLNQKLKKVPFEIFGYSMATAFESEANGGELLDVSIRQAAMHPGGPGMAFVQSPEVMFEMVVSFESIVGPENLEVVALGAERMIRLARKTPLKWVQDYYHQISKAGSYAA